MSVVLVYLLAARTDQAKAVYCLFLLSLYLFFKLRLSVLGKGASKENSQRRKATMRTYEFNGII